MDSKPMSAPLKPSILKTSSGRILQLGSKMGTYVLLSEQLPLESFGMAKGANDILTCFHHEERLVVGHEGRDDTAPSYEILIGGWLNTKTVVRKKGCIQVSVTKTNKPEAMITTSDFDKYWIAIEGDRLSVGKGDPGENKLLSWHDPTPSSGIRYIGFGSWHSPVLIKNIKIMRPVVPEARLARRFDPLKAHDWLSEGRFSDVALVTSDSQEFLVHRAVLYSVSKKFQSLVRGVEDGRLSTYLVPYYKMPDTLSGPILAQIIRFIYLGKVIVDLVDAPMLRVWADYYEIRSLLNLCTLFESQPDRYSQFEMNIYSPEFLSMLSEPLPPTYNFASIYQKSLFSDVILVIKPQQDQPDNPGTPLTYSTPSVNTGQKTIPVHKIILALKSEPLGLMFSTGMKESQMSKVEFHEDYTIFELMLRYIYYNDATFLTNQPINEVLIPLLVMADRFAVYPLRSALSHILASFIDVDTACGLLNWSTFYSLTTCRRKALKFIETHFSEVVRSSEFVGLEAGPLLEIIFGDDLVVPSEVDVYEALLFWGYGTIDPESQTTFEHPDPKVHAFFMSMSPEEQTQRLDELTQLLSYVRFSLMDPITLQGILESKLVQNTAFLKEIVLEAVQDKLHRITLSSSGYVEGQKLNKSTNGGSMDFGALSYSFSASSEYVVSNSTGNLPSSVPIGSPLQTIGNSPRVSGSGSQLSNSFGSLPLETGIVKRSTSSSIGSYHLNSRKTNAKHLLFSHDGDENGSIYWIATNSLTERWQNPHKTGKVLVSSSSPASRWTNYSAIVNRSFITNNFATGDADLPAWWCVDLSAKYRLCCDYYSIQTDGSANVIADWQLQGSVDKQTWNILSVHENSKSTFTQGGGKWYSWSVETQTLPPGYRYFRLIVSGNSATQRHKFSLAAFEIYGFLYSTPEEILQNADNTTQATSSTTNL